MNLLRLLLTGSSLLLSALVLSAQPVLTPRDGGQVTTLGVTDNTLFDQIMITIEGVGTNARLEQERQNLKPYMMPVRKMGFRGTDWSYMLAAATEYYVNISRNFKDNLSPDFISLSLLAEGQQRNLVGGLKFLAQNGTVSAAIVPYDAAQIPSTVYATATYKIVNYLHLFQNFASPREKIFEMRKALMRGNPILIQMQADTDFASEGASRIWEPRGRNNEQTYTLLVVGYDENLQAFELLSSWGAEWGNNGYLWITYNDLANRATNGFVIVPDRY